MNRNIPNEVWEDGARTRICFYWRVVRKCLADVGKRDKVRPCTVAAKLPRIEFDRYEADLSMQISPSAEWPKGTFGLVFESRAEELSVSENGRRTGPLYLSHTPVA